MKILYFIVAISIFFVGCSEEKREKVLKKPEQEQLTPEIPISKSDNNTSIDINFPPEPVE